MAESQAKRLDRIEEKIDKLTDAMVSIARSEEKIVALEKRFSLIEQDRQEYYEKLEIYHQKMDAIDAAVTRNGNTINIINRLFWIVLVAVVGALSTHLFGI